MKKRVIKIAGSLLIGCLLSSFLIACDSSKSGRNPFLDNHKHYYWGDEDYYDIDDDYGYWEDDDDDDYSYNNNNNQGNHGDNGGSTGVNDEMSFDDSSTMFSHSFSDCSSGTVAIQANPDNCKDSELTIPSTYIDSTGAKYKVVKDYGNGFSYLSAQKITLLDGFMEIHEGFDQCMYVKRIVLPASITKIEGEILVSCVSLTTIDYAGTKNQWNAISKDSRWNYKAPALTISCKDGLIDIPKWED